MFERFSSNARQSILNAQEEARTLGNNYLGSEHLLLGMASVEGCKAALVLEGMGVDVHNLRSTLSQMLGEASEDVSAKELPFTPHAKRVLEGALREALALGHEQIGTEHVLLGLLRGTPR